MPFPKKKGKKQASKNIAEFHKGKTFAKTKAKFGKKVADKQAIAAGLHGAGLSVAQVMGKKSPMKMRGEKGMESYAKKRKS